VALVVALVVAFVLMMLEIGITDSVQRWWWCCAGGVHVGPGGVGVGRTRRWWRW